MTAFRRLSVVFLCLLLCVFTVGCQWFPVSPSPDISLDTIPAYNGEPYAILNDNQPLFTKDDLTVKAYESYRPLDELGRCGDAVACLGRELMPTEERGSIGSVKPSGWQTLKFDFVDGKYLYNRCHLIGFQLSGENANERNLITGTRYMNVQGMLPFENMVADYIRETDNHVMYRVIPVYEEDHLVASGVTIEAYSVEDQGEGICFYVYCYNVQPGVTIDYANGNAEESPISNDGEHGSYILNTNSDKIHKADCDAAQNVSPDNRQDYEGSLELLLLQGYKTAGCCFD